jgi:uncharacterized protein YunC (DUF1805 family)
LGLLGRLAFIRHCRSLDMTLNESRLLLRFRDAPEQNCGEVNSLLDEHIGHVATRIAELRALQSQLKKLRELCEVAHAAKDCGILKELAADSGVSNHGKRHTRQAIGHVRGSHGPRKA